MIGRRGAAYVSGQAIDSRAEPAATLL